MLIFRDIEKALERVCKLYYSSFNLRDKVLFSMIYFILCYYIMPSFPFFLQSSPINFTRAHKNTWSLFTLCVAIFIDVSVHTCVFLNITCYVCISMYVFKTDHLILDKQLVYSSLGNTNFLTLYISWLLVVVCVG